MLSALAVSLNEAAIVVPAIVYEAEKPEDSWLSADESVPSLYSCSP